MWSVALLQGDISFPDIKDFTLAAEAESSLLTNINVKLQGRWRGQSLFTRCSHPLGDGLTLEWPQRLVHAACLAAKHMHTLANAHKPSEPAQPCARVQRDNTAVAHTEKKNMRPHVGRLMWETDDCRYTPICTQTYIRTSAEQRTLLDCFNSVSFKWFRAFWEVSLPQLIWVGFLEHFVHHFLQQIEFHCFLFGWWSISWCRIFRLYRPTAGAESQRLIVFIKITVP